jgi:hypothetical protein
MERYLLSLGKTDLTNIIQTFASESDLHVNGSGATFRWLGILRAAEKHWRTTPDYALFRSEVEGTSGLCPHLVYNIQDR